MRDASQPIMLPKRPTFALLGCFGEKNTGDEAMLAATLHLVRRHWPQARLIAFSDRPSETARRFGVEAVSSLGLLHPRSVLALWRRGQLGPVLAALRECDCLVLAGGELLRTDFGLRAVLTILDRALVARFLGKPVLMLGIGVGPLEPGLARTLIRLACARAIILTREEESAAALARVGVPGAHGTTDLAFQLPKDAPDLSLPAGPRLAFCLRDPALTLSSRGLSVSREDFLTAVSGLADQAVELGATPVFVPFSWKAGDDDRHFHREVALRMADSARAFLVEEEELAPGRVLGLIGAMDMVVGMRLHSCVFALSQGRPLLALAYDAKVRKLMHHFRLGDHCVSLDCMDRAPELLRRIWGARAGWDTVRPSLAEDQRAFEKLFGAAMGLAVPQDDVPPRPTGA